ncbi:hypothetical protein MLD38_022204 [Melastoma candidum]|uniref:Uncharacterized protein n=1 Tax=Melastoma candidum TaxID=119954 RepID=A0ACB9QIP8_9MYRT|nr:hypothetical protein MLD38_022204 [Melastoma candidum]
MTLMLSVFFISQFFFFLRAQFQSGPRSRDKNPNGARGGAVNPPPLRLPWVKQAAGESGSYIASATKCNCYIPWRTSLTLTITLQMAVVQERGGRNSDLIAEQLGQDVLSWFTQSKEPLYIDDLEQILENGLMSLNTMEEDGSTEEVCNAIATVIESFYLYASAVVVEEKLMILHEECLDGNFNSIQKVADDEDEDTSDTGRSMEMAVDAPESRPGQSPEVAMGKEPKPAKAVDPDGWTENKGRKK